MFRDEEEEDMAVRHEDVTKKKGTGSVSRKSVIRAIGQKLCDRNDDGLRRLAKS